MAADVRDAPGRGVPPYFRSSDHATKPLTEALEKLATGRVDEWRTETLAALQYLVEPMPAHLLQHRDPGTGEPTPEGAALHYRVAAEFVSRFRKYREGREGKDPDAAAALSRGLILDLWDMWGRAASGSSPDSTLLLEPGRGRVVEPAVVRDALCECDRDVARLLLRDKQEQGYSHENALREQVRWQLLHLTRSKAPFAAEDRAVLYELLRHFHYRFSDVDTGLCLDAVRRLVDAGQQFRRSVESLGETALPEAPQTAFRAEDGIRVETEKLVEDQNRTIDTLQVLFSHGLGEEAVFDDLPKRILEAAKRKGIHSWSNDEKDERNEEEPFELLLRRMLLFWAARSRIIRDALYDLLGYCFPTKESPPPEEQDVHTGCDCWIALVGNRQTGKTSFMRSLTAALMPDGTNLEPEEVEWSRSRVRFLKTSVFRESEDRTKVIELSETPKENLDGWLAGRKEKGTALVPPYIAEVDTGRMARLCFFDIAGEGMHDERTGRMKSDIAELLENHSPVAAVYVDSDPAYAEHEDSVERDKSLVDYSPVKVGVNAPIYIIINKYDLFLKEYKGKAKEEMKRSLACEDEPTEHDADRKANTEAFFSLRQIAFDEGGVPTHNQIIGRLEDHPAVIRRPHYHKRLRKDIRRLGRLLDSLLKEGRRDISLAYLVSTPSGRKQPEEFHGMRVLWTDIETRVVSSTGQSRRKSIRKLLDEIPRKQEEGATRTYGNLASVFDGTALRNIDPGSLPRAWEEFERTVKAEMEREGEAVLRHVAHALKELRTILAKRRALELSLNEAVEDFLWECGIDPEGRFDRELITLIEPPGEWKSWHLDNASVAICDAIKSELGKEPIAFSGQVAKEHVDRLLRAVIDDIPEEASANNVESESLERVEFDVTGNGVKLPEEHVQRIGAMRGPALHCFGHRRVLSSPFSGTVRERVLVDGASMQTDSDDPFLVVEALYNIEKAEDGRYPNLTLEDGELDFYRTRVLTEDWVLAPIISRFRRDALDMMKMLLAARKDISSLREDLLANALMALEIHRTLVDLKLDSIDNLLFSAKEETMSAEALGDQIATAQKIREELGDLMNPSRPGLAKQVKRIVKGDDTAREISRLYDENADFWNKLDSESARVLSTGAFDSEGGFNRDTWKKLEEALSRIRTKLILLRTLGETVTAVRKGISTIGSQEERKQVQEKLSNPHRVLSLNARIPPRLRVLRFTRLLLVMGYPLRYLTMSRWIEETWKCAGNDEEGKAIESRLQKAWQALNRANDIVDRASRGARKAAGARSPTADNHGASPTSLLQGLRSESSELCRGLCLHLEEEEADSLWGECQ